MSDRIRIFEVILKGRGRKWVWSVRTTAGKAIMMGAESSRQAASYEANRALFLLLLSAPYRSRVSARAIGRGLQPTGPPSAHQSGDAIQAVHAGVWRGIFGHRNTLGLWAGLSVATVLIFGKYGLGRISVRAACAARRTEIAP
jgi:hypothetical protein